MSELRVDAIKNSSGAGSLSLSGGNFNFDGNTLFVDATNNRVGVGTGTPSVPFEVTATGGIKLASAPLMEGVNIVAATVNSVSNIDLLTSGVHMFTSAGTGNWAHNVRGNGSTALNSILSVGQATVFTLITALGSSAGYSATLQIDGTNQTVAWTSATPPAGSGGSSGWDIYSYTIIKRANASFTVFGSYTQFG
tara:strand:+ start:81 stop:662 length:582 start_codon:yes stop_codon:yes gene_type:complete